MIFAVILCSISISFRFWRLFTLFYSFMCGNYRNSFLRAIFNICDHNYGRIPHYYADGETVSNCQHKHKPKNKNIVRYAGVDGELVYKHQQNNEVKQRSRRQHNTTPIYYDQNPTKTKPTPIHSQHHQTPNRRTDNSQRQGNKILRRRFCEAQHST